MPELSNCPMTVDEQRVLGRRLMSHAEDADLIGVEVAEDITRAVNVIAEQAMAIGRVREPHAPRQLYEMDDHDRIVNDDQGCPVVWLTICTGCSSEEVIEALDMGERVEDGEDFVRYENCPVLSALGGPDPSRGGETGG